MKDFWQLWLGSSIGSLIYLFATSVYRSGHIVPERFSSFGQGVLSAVVESVFTGLLFALIMAVYLSRKTTK